jgi:two-component system, cell cycle sensor histidine kinase and response regulator CckA
MSAATPFPRTPESTEPKSRLLFEHAPFGVAHCSHQGAIIAMNQALERLLGVTLATMPSPHFADLAQTGDRGESNRLFHELIDGERDSFHIDNQVLAPDGSTAWIRWTAWRVPGSDGQPNSSLVLAEDTTESHQSEQRLHQAERLETLGRLAGGVAHDFNNLITGVLLYCDLLLVGLDPGSRLRKYVEEIRAAGLQATGLVRQLLAVARPQNAKPQLLSLNDVVEGMRTLLRRLIGENILLQFQLDLRLGLVRMDPTQAQQILLNLVLNARDAVSEGGHITVETCNCQIQVLADRKSGSNGAGLPCALLIVSDNGKGMDLETRRHLFEAFFTTKAPGRGTGLGLTTVHDIVTRSGGLIHVDSETGSGTRITVLLPLVPDAALHALTPDI